MVIQRDYDEVSIPLSGGSARCTYRDGVHWPEMNFRFFRSVLVCVLMKTDPIFLLP